jgi:hypothetical protein
MFDCLNAPPVLSSNIRPAFVAYLKQAISYQKLESPFSKEQNEMKKNEQYEKCYLDTRRYATSNKLKYN